MVVVTHAVEQKLFLSTERKTSCSRDIELYYYFPHISALHYRQHTVAFICRTRKHHYRSGCCCMSLRSTKTESRTSLDD